MDQSLNYQVHTKEIFYFVIKLIFSLIVYSIPIIIWQQGMLDFAGLVSNIVVIYVLSYVVILGFLLMIRMGVIVGYLRGNAVKINKQQFPDIQEITDRQAKQLGLKRTPDVYILQAGGLLNAFAARFMGRNYIVLYSDVLEEAYENNLESVEFVIAHELGHIKRKHMQKQLWLFPSAFIPFLSQAYSRACEYTCDNIGAALCPKGAVTGLVLLASGKKLYKKVDVDVFIEQKRTENGFWTWFAEKISTHPRLTKRVARLKKEELVVNPPNKSKSFSRTAQPVDREEIANKEVKIEDHSKYLPQ